MKKAYAVLVGLAVLSGIAIFAILFVFYPIEKTINTGGTFPSSTPPTVTETQSSSASPVLDNKVQQSERVPPGLLRIEDPSAKLMRLLKEKVPDIHAVLMEHSQNILERKKSLKEMQIEVAPALSGAINRYLPYSDREALIDFTRQFIVLGTILEKSSPEACRQYVLGEDVAQVIDAVPYPPLPSWRRET